MTINTNVFCKLFRGDEFVSSIFLRRRPWQLQQDNNRYFLHGKKQHQTSTFTANVRFQNIICKRL